MCNRPDFSTDKLPIESFDRCCIVVVNLLFCTSPMLRGILASILWLLFRISCAMHGMMNWYSQRDLDLKPWIVWRDPWNLKQTSKLDPSQIAWWRISFQSKILWWFSTCWVPQIPWMIFPPNIFAPAKSTVGRRLSFESTYFFWSYCWWTKSCTTKYDDNPIIYRVLTIPNGAGFLPSTVC